MDEANEGFGIPEAPKKPETQEERLARLQALADLKIGEESDAEIVERLVKEARARRQEEEFPKDTSGFPAEYDKVMIYASTQEYDLPYVPLGINGFVIKAPRDREIIMPHVFVSECLEHAVETSVTQAKGGLVLRSRHRFPYKFIGKATKDEYEAFQAKEREQAARELAQAA